MAGFFTNKIIYNTMKIIEFIRLILKHLLLLIFSASFSSAFDFSSTRKPNLEYTSQTLLYTGLATGSSVEMEKHSTILQYQLII
jgi:hypothetical protein